MKLQSPILRNIALSFVLLTVLLAAGVSYLALGRAVITVHLGGVSREVSFRYTLEENRLGQTLSESALGGSFFETTDTVSGTFLPQDTGAVKTGKAGGSVTLRNDTDRPQPLVATTRLLTPDGKLFRLQTAVRVPARGTVSAPVAADAEGEEFEVGPTRFTIPGLSPTLQQSIYATSDAPMVRGASDERVITEQDLEAARVTLKERAVAAAIEAVRVQAPQYVFNDQDILVTVGAEQSSAKVGDKARSFSLSLDVSTLAVAFDKAELLRRIETATQGVVVSSPDQVTYALVNYDPIARSVILAGQARGESAISASSSIFHPANFVGMSVDQIQKSLANYDGVEEVNVSFSPYWIQSAPKAPGRIEIRFQ